MTPMHHPEFAAIRRRIGWTQEQVATFFDVTGRTVIRWEQGDTPIPVATAMLLRLIVSGRVRNVDITETATKVAEYVV